MLARRLRRATQVAAASGLTFVGGATASSTGSSNSFSLTGLTGGIASAPAAGDLVIVAVATKYGTDQNITCSTSGYTEVADLFQTDTAATNMAVYYKRLSSAETSVSLNWVQNTGARVVIHVWRGSDASSPLDATTTTATGANSGIPNAPSITTVTDNAVVIAIGAAAFDNVVSNDLTVPSGMENFFQTTNSFSGGIGIASVVRASAGAYNPAAFGGSSSNSANSWCAATLAIRPG